jgi:hypothetical protein
VIACGGRPVVEVIFEPAAAGGEFEAGAPVGSVHADANAVAPDAASVDACPAAEAAAATLSCNAMSDAGGLCTELDFYGDRSYVNQQQHVPLTCDFVLSTKTCPPGAAVGCRQTFQQDGGCGVTTNTIWYYPPVGGGECGGDMVVYQ